MSRPPFNRTLAMLNVAAEVRGLIEASAPTPEDRELLWDAVKCKIDDEPFFVERDEPSLTVGERQR